MSGRDLKVHYTWIHRVSQHVHIHSWKWRLKKYTAATIIKRKQWLLYTKATRHAVFSFAKQNKREQELRPYVK